MPDGRPNQRQRTRKDLLAAAAKLMQQGRTPTLDEVAEAAMVSRATAYRYFPGVEALLVEASVDVEVPEADAILKGVSADPIARLECSASFPPRRIIALPLLRHRAAASLVTLGRLS